MLEDSIAGHVAWGSDRNNGLRGMPMYDIHIRSPTERPQSFQFPKTYLQSQRTDKEASRKNQQVSRESEVRKISKACHGIAIKEVTDLRISSSIDFVINVQDVLPSNAQRSLERNKPSKSFLYQLAVPFPYRRDWLAVFSYSDRYSNVRKHATT